MAMPLRPLLVKGCEFADRQHNLKECTLTLIFECRLEQSIFNFSTATNLTKKLNIKKKKGLASFSSGRDDISMQFVLGIFGHVGFFLNGTHL